MSKRKSAGIQAGNEMASLVDDELLAKPDVSAGTSVGRDMAATVDSALLKPNVSAGTKAGQEMAALTDSSLLKTKPVKLQSMDELMQAVRDLDFKAKEPTRDHHPNETARSKLDRTFGRLRQNAAERRTQVEIGQPEMGAQVEIGEPVLGGAQPQMASSMPAPAPARETKEQYNARVKAEDAPVEVSPISPLDLIGPSGAAYKTETAIMKAAEHKAVSKFMNDATWMGADAIAGKTMSGAPMKAAEKYAKHELPPIVKAAEESPEYLAKQAQAMKEWVASASTKADDVVDFAHGPVTHAAKLKEHMFQKAIDAAKKEGKLSEFLDDIVTNVVGKKAATDAATRAK